MIIDTHVHLEDPKFAPDLDRVLRRAADAGVERLVCISTDLEDSLQSIALAERHPQVFATVGIHPQNEEKFGADSEGEIRRLALHNQVVALGEMGIDYHYPGFRKSEQREAFVRQALIASYLRLPMVIHCRDAYEDLIAIFKNDKSITARGVVHCFSGDREHAAALIDLGFYLGIGGALTYPKSADLRATVAGIGLDRIVCETDGPYLPPQKKRGRRNEPSYLKFTVAELAAVTRHSYQEVASITTANAMRLYKMDAPTPDEINQRTRGILILDVSESLTAGEIIQGIENFDSFSEFNIGGRSEPTLRLEAALELARLLKARGCRVRLVTDGQGSRHHQRNIAPELLGLFDAITIEMTHADDRTMIDFASEAKKFVPEVCMRLVAGPGVDVEACRRIAEDELRVRFQVEADRPTAPALI